MDKHELLYDHYKDTCEIQRTNLSTRNKLFASVVVLLGTMLLFVYRPDTIAGLLVAAVKEKYSVDISLSLGILQSLLWAALLYASVRYYQSSINIERTYKYIHCLEKRISDEIQAQFDREGVSYLTKYPKCSDAIDILYKWAFPLLYIIGLLVKITLEIRLSWGFFLDAFICGIAITLCILYIAFNLEISNEYKKQS